VGKARLTHAPGVPQVRRVLADDRVRRARVSLRLRLADAVDEALRRRDALTPPRRLNFVGNSDFQTTGDEFLEHFKRFGELRESDRVLDIGCGIGRMARVLVPELKPPNGSYDGFDIVADAIHWCQHQYRATAVPFRFTHVDLCHPEYNPSGTGSADTFTFPYADASFDLAIATSVFTHLLDDAAERYLSEAARVLAPGGRLFSTWFVIDPALPADPAKAIVRFDNERGASLVADPGAPESAVAYRLPWLRERMHAHGLILRDPVHRGWWAGQQGPSSQDIVVAERATP
jgi:SAM-dependent methyltransferase